jgi:hypothetical protein
MAVQADVTAGLDDGAAQTKLSAPHAFDPFAEVNRSEDALSDQFVISRCGLLAEHHAGNKERQRPGTQGGEAVDGAHRGFHVAGMERLSAIPYRQHCAATGPGDSGERPA